MKSKLAPAKKNFSTSCPFDGDRLVEMSCDDVKRDASSAVSDGCAQPGVALCALFESGLVVDSTRRFVSGIDCKRQSRESVAFGLNDGAIQQSFSDGMTAKPGRNAHIDDFECGP